MITNYTNKIYVNYQKVLQIGTPGNNVMFTD